MNDFICNYYGARSWAAALEWPGYAHSYIFSLVHL